MHGEAFLSRFLQLVSLLFRSPYPLEGCPHQGNREASASVAQAFKSEAEPGKLEVGISYVPDCPAAKVRITHLFLHGVRYVLLRGDSKDSIQSGHRAELLR